MLDYIAYIYLGILLTAAAAATALNHGYRFYVQREARKRDSGSLRNGEDRVAG